MVAGFFFGGGCPEKEVIRGSIDEEEDGAVCVLYCATALFNGGKVFFAGWGCFGVERIVALVVTPREFWRCSGRSRLSVGWDISVDCGFWWVGVWRL